MKTFKELNEITSKKDWFYHASDSDLDVGKRYKYKGKGKGTFGGWESVFQKNKPSGENSRLTSFYLTKNKNFAEEFGYNLYKVRPIGKYSICALGWLGILMYKFDSMVTGVSKGGGYNLSSPTKEQKIMFSDLMKKYYGGKPPTKKDTKQHDYEDAETPIIEILATEIEIIKTLS